MQGCRSQLAVVVVVGVALSAALPCYAQSEGSESSVQANAVHNVLWLTPADPELGNRVRGQLIDTAWQLVERPTHAQFNAGDSNAQLRTAFAGARQTQAAAVAWVREDAARIQVLVLDVAQSRLSVRDVPRQVDDGAQQSAAFETVALIVRATLVSIESGTQVGDAVVEPSAPAPVAQDAPNVERTTRSQPPSGDGGVALWARMGAQVNLNSDQILFGPGVGLGLTVEPARFGLVGHWLLPHEQQASYVEAGVTRQVALDLWRLGVAVSAEYEWALSSQWAVFLGLQPGLTVLHRATQRSATIQPSSDASHLLPTLGVTAGVAGPQLADTFTPELTLGLQAFARLPTLRLGPAPEAALDQQLARFEPWLGLAFRLP